MAVSRNIVKMKGTTILILSLSLRLAVAQKLRLRHYVKEEGTYNLGTLI